jgi:hypothetical protein
VFSRLAAAIQPSQAAAAAAASWDPADAAAAAAAGQLPQQDRAAAAALGFSIPNLQQMSSAVPAGSVTAGAAAQIVPEVFDQLLKPAAADGTAAATASSSNLAAAPSSSMPAAGSGAAASVEAGDVLMMDVFGSPTAAAAAAGSHGFDSIDAAADDVELAGQQHIPAVHCQLRNPAAAAAAAAAAEAAAAGVEGGQDIGAVGAEPAGLQLIPAAHFLQAGKCFMKDLKLGHKCHGDAIKAFEAVMDKWWQLVKQLESPPQRKIMILPGGFKENRTSRGSGHAYTCCMTVVLLTGTGAAESLAEQFKVLSEAQQAKLLKDLSENSPNSSTALTGSQLFEAAFPKPVLKVRSVFKIVRSSKGEEYQEEDGGSGSTPTPVDVTTRRAVHKLKVMLLLLYKLQAVPAAEMHPALLQLQELLPQPVVPQGTEQLTDTQQKRADLMNAMAGAGV